MAGLIGTNSAGLEWERFGYGAAVSVLVVILLTELVLYARVQAHKRKDLPPGPRSLPILGNLPALGAMPHQSLQHLAANFGPLMYIRLGSVPSVVVSTAESARQLVRANDECLSSRPKTLSLSIISEYQTMASAPSPGKLWHSLRRFSANELLSAKRVASYEGIRKEELINMMQVLLETSNRGEALDLKHWLFQTAANLMTRMLVNKRIHNGNGADYSYQDEMKEEFDQWLQGRRRYILTPIIGDYVPCLRFYSETVQGWRRKVEAFVDRQMALGMKMLELEKRRQRAAEKEDDESYVPDFVDVMLGAPVDEGKIPSDNFLIKQSMEFFSAGIESSSTMVEWALAELVVHPVLMKRAREEIDDVVGSHRLVQESDIPKLHFLQAVVKETFRVRVPSPFGMPRESTAPVEALGYKIPTGTRIIYNLYAIQRDPDVYENPDVFDPDRFLQHHAHVNHLAAFDSYELIPFGVGRRMCPAYNLGNTVVHFMLANLIHSYDWSVPDGGSLDMTEAMVSVVVRLKKPLTLMPKLRDGFPAL